MLFAAVVLALATPSSPARADPVVFMATNAEKESGFATLTECERALGLAAQPGAQHSTARPGAVRGTVFNRAAGNVSRCETIGGEVQLVVYPAPQPR